VAGAAVPLLATPAAGAATVSVESGIVSVIAAPHEVSAYSIQRQQGAFLVTSGADLLTAGPGCALRVMPGVEPGRQITCGDAGVTSARMVLGSGPSTVNTGADSWLDLPLTVQGGAMGDQLRTYGSGPAQLYGADGDDRLEARGPGADLVDGGPGDDDLSVGEPHLPKGADTLVGGPGNDSFNVPWGVSGIRIDCGPGRDHISDPEPLTPGNVLTADCPPAVIVKPLEGTDRPAFVRSTLAGRRLRLRLRLSEPARGGIALATGGGASFARRGKTVRASIRLSAKDLRRLQSARRRRGFVFARIGLRDASGEAGGATVPLRIRRARR
jgi:RTX calcium-binding nonapeptide repeat (4 copies)